MKKALLNSTAPIEPSAQAAQVHHPQPAAHIDMPPGCAECDRYLNFAELKMLLGGLSRPTAWRMEKEGRLPKRIVLSSGAVRWRLSDVRRYIAAMESGEIAPPASYTRERPKSPGQLGARATA